MRRVVVAALGVTVAGVPGGLAALAALEILGRWGRRRRPRPVDALPLAVRLLVLVGAGLPLSAALEAAAGATSEVAAALRRSRRVGTPAALAAMTGPLAPLLSRLGEAAASGAPLEPAIRAYIDGERRHRHTGAIERARRLPVRLMIPMTLLVLPGFVVMVYGPAVVALVADLIGPLAP